MNKWTDGFSSMTSVCTFSFMSLQFNKMYHNMKICRYKKKKTSWKQEETLFVLSEVIDEVTKLLEMFRVENSHFLFTAYIQAIIDNDCHCVLSINSWCTTDTHTHTLSHSCRVGRPRTSEGSPSSQTASELQNRNSYIIQRVKVLSYFK